MIHITGLMEITGPNWPTSWHPFEPAEEPAEYRFCRGDVWLSNLPVSRNLTLMEQAAAALNRIEPGIQVIAYRPEPKPRV